MLWMAEWSEILMSLTSNWNAGDSSGEGLSHYCAVQLFLAGHNDYYGGGFVQNWLNGDRHDRTRDGRRPMPPAPTGSTHTFTGATRRRRVTCTATAIRSATAARSASSTT